VQGCVVLVLFVCVGCLCFGLCFVCVHCMDVDYVFCVIC